MERLLVARETNIKKLAGAIAYGIEKNGCAEIAAIGAGAVNQAVKAVAFARGILAPQGKSVAMEPSFQITNNTDDKEERTVMVLLVSTLEQWKTGSVVTEN